MDLQFKFSPITGNEVGNICSNLIRELNIVHMKLRYYFYSMLKRLCKEDTCHSSSAYYKILNVNKFVYQMTNC